MPKKNLKLRLCVIIWGISSDDENIFILLLCCVTVLKVAGEETNRFAVDLLEAAFAKSPNITFSATWFEPIEFITPAGNKVWRKWCNMRLMENGSICNCVWSRPNIFSRVDA